MTAPALPELHAVRNVAADLVAWRLGASERVTARAKIAGAFAPGEGTELWPEVEIVTRDRHLDRSATRSLEAATDRAPILPRAEILVVGHAYIPSGRAAPFITAQLLVADATRQVLQKQIAVYGDRADAHAQPTPFARMPLEWERTHRTIDNPVGADAATRMPNLIDPRDPTRAAGFAPIAPMWPSRRALLRDTSRHAVEGDIIELPDGFDLSYFQAAPGDQQLERLGGNEWVALDGLHPALPRLQFKLPGYFALGRLAIPGKPTLMFPLVADRLVLDADRQIGTLTYRGTLTQAFADLTGARVELGLQRGDETAMFPNVLDPATRREVTRGAAPVAPAGTMTFNLADISAHALPFAPSPSSPASASSRDLPPVTPFELRAVQAGASHAPVEPSRGSAPVTPFEMRAATPPTPAMVAPPAAVAPPPPMAAPPPPISSPTMGAQVPPSRPSDVAQPSPLPEAKASEAPPAEPPQRKRSKQDVPTLSDVGFSVISFAWQVQPPQTSLVVVVKGTFDLVEGQPAKLREESEFPQGDVFVDEDLEKGLLSASDFAILKPEVDVLVSGHAYAPKGQSATAMQVSLRMKTAKGVLDRSIAVFGDRTWQTGVPSSAAPFEKIPLVYERAFGGPQVPANPVGVGHKGAAGPDGKKRLPNFETPGKLIRSPGDTPPVAGLGAIHPVWKPRWDLARQRTTRRGSRRAGRIIRPTSTTRVLPGGARGAAPAEGERRRGVRARRGCTPTAGHSAVACRVSARASSCRRPKVKAARSRRCR